MANLLIAGGRVIDPASGHDGVADVALADGIVAAVGSGGGQRALDRSHADMVLDAEGLIVSPGLIDPHVHLREPGAEEAETIASGSAAAAAGGFASVVCMPNTTPALDDAAMIEFIYTAAERGRAGQNRGARVFPVGAISRGRRGEELAEIGLMARAGAVGFSDDGDCVANAALMARALAYIKPTGRALMQHCEETTLTRGAGIHAGSVAVRLGLSGWPRVAEEMIIERDARLNRAVGCAYHVQHLSSSGSVEIVRRARREGQPVTAEVSPHHLLLTDEAVDSNGGYWTAAKMNPPLREKSDIAAFLEGVADGTITVLATDHAPHTADRKALEFEAAPFGIVGLETALALYIKALIEPGVIDWPGLIAMMTMEPARLCGLDGVEGNGGRTGGLGLGRLRVGSAGDVTLIDPNIEWTIDPGTFRSRSRNTPFGAWRVKGRAVATIVAGDVVFDITGRAATRGQKQYTEIAGKGQSSRM